jgi:SAM-dependent methyltransferase
LTIGKQIGLSTLPICPVCGGSDRVRLLFSRNGDSVHRCLNCRVEFLFPQPNDAALSAIYSGGYFIGSDNQADSDRVAQLKRATASLYLRCIQPFIRVAAPRILEIGCGSGDFLLEAKSRGFQVEGLEFSPHAAATANDRLGISAVTVGSPDSTELPRDRYDLIVGFDVIEHVRDPTHTIHRLHSALSADGVLALVTPSLDSWSRRLLRNYWMEYKTEHLTYFSKRSLRLLLTKYGFKSIMFFPNYKILSIDYISRHFERYPVPVISPLLRLLRRSLPGRLANMRLKLVASGTMVLARKS